MAFFDKYNHFLETSMVGNWPARLNARYEAIINANKLLFEGARVLDLASHDGRWSFAALDAGAASVVGIEVRPEMVANANQNMAKLGISSDRYQFVAGDLFEHKEIFQHKFDLVLCLGLFYHTARHVELLKLIHSTNTPTIIIDTAIVPLNGNFSYISAEPADKASNGNDDLGVINNKILIAVPTVGALVFMLQHFGYTVQQIDWDKLIKQLAITTHKDQPLTAQNPVGDYYLKRRGTFIATLNTI